MFNTHLRREVVEKVLDAKASSELVSMRLAGKLGICNRTSKVLVRQRDLSFVKGNCITAASSKVMDSSFVLNKFMMDAEV